VKRAIRVGTCGALVEGMRHGDLVVAGEAFAEDGASRALGAGETADPDRELTARLAAETGAETGNATVPARIVSTDLFYESGPGGEAPPPDRAENWRQRGAVAVEMEAATLFTLGDRLGVATACVLAVSDVFSGGRRQRIGDQELAAAAKRMGSVAAGALAG
jgi:uridine phosphorylase